MMSLAGFRRAALLAVVLAPGAGRCAEEGGYPFWLVFLPGGGQIYQGQAAAGAACMAATTGLAGWGVWVERSRGSGEINAPLICAQQVYAASLYGAYRDFSLRRPPGEEGRSARLDPTPMSGLASAPFRLENLLNPWVLGFAALAAALNAADVDLGRGRPGIGSVRGMRYLGDGYRGRDRSLAGYTAYWFPLSYGAGESEEMLYRGMLQATWEDRWGPACGLLAASAVFGLSHLTAPRREESWWNAGFATLAGLYLGWRFQRTGYRLSEPVAAHVWFDVAAGLTVFLLDPAENPLGARVKFSF